MGFGVLRVVMMMDASCIIIFGHISGGGFRLRVDARLSALFFGRLGDEKAVGAIGDSGCFPWETPEGHATEDDG